MSIEISFDFRIILIALEFFLGVSLMLINQPIDVHILSMGKW
jgi:hypothetical protein